ncbi:TetR family transcriptional regulator [Oricola sp.]|uniref:TetR family transcriptional regulator n=1 Tax=Oricola sp. TaxID=1979950 RepID=UPI003BAA0552
MSERVPRKRNASATKSAILASAKRAFTAKGFEAAGVREIAADVGVSVALINRYFGSKEGLFIEAVVPEIHFDDLIEGDRSTFGQRAAEYYCNKAHEGLELDVTLACLRSINSPTVTRAIDEATEQHVVEKLARWLGGRNARQRAALIVAHLIGFDMMKRINSVSALQAENAQLAFPYLAATIQSYVDDDTLAPPLGRPD